MEVELRVMLIVIVNMVVTLMIFHSMVSWLFVTTLLLKLPMCKGGNIWEFCFSHCIADCTMYSTNFIICIISKNKIYTIFKYYIIYAI